MKIINNVKVNTHKLINLQLYIKLTMPKIVNLKVVEIDKLSEFQKGKSVISGDLGRIKKELKFDILELLPKNPYNKVSFSIKDTNSSFANSIRRVLVSEIPVWSLVIDEESFDTDDPLIRSDDLGGRIMCLPIHQVYLNKISDKENNKEKFVNNLLKFKMYAKNKTPEYTTVYSKEIEISGASSSKINISKFVDGGIDLQTLSPGCYVKIKLILQKGYGYEHGGKFSLTPMPFYRPIDHIPLELKHKSKSSGISSSEIDPTEFEFMYRTYTYYKNPLEIMLWCIDELKRRVNLVGKHIADYEKSVKEGRGKESNILKGIPKELWSKIIIFKNEYIEIRKENHTYFFDLTNESLTISKLFSRYVYDSYRQIALVTDASYHPSQRMVFIKIQDENAIKLMAKAHTDIIKDLNSIRKSFE